MSYELAGTPGTASVSLLVCAPGRNRTPMRAAGPVKPHFPRASRSRICSTARSRGQGGAPDWTNDLDAGEDRRRLLRREDPEQQAELVSHTPIRASKGKIRMTMEYGPGCSVKKVGRLSGTVRFASAPGTEAFSESCGVLAHLLEDVEATSEKLS